MNKDPLVLACWEASDGEKSNRAGTSWGEWFGLLVLGLGLLLCAHRALLRYCIGGGPSAQGTIVNNLRQLDGAKEQLGVEQRLSATWVVSRADVMPYLRPGWPKSIAKETYSLGRFGEPVTARLGKQMGSFPEGATIRLGTNDTEPYLVEVRR